MTRKNIYRILLIVFSVIVVTSFIFPQINAKGMLPGEDAAGEFILIEVDNYYTMIDLISVFGNFLSIVPILYIVLVLVYGLLLTLKSIGKKISNGSIVVVLMYPIISTTFALMSAFTIFGGIVVISLIACVTLVLIDETEEFITIRNQEMNLTKQ